MTPLALCLALMTTSLFPTPQSVSLEEDTFFQLVPGTPLVLSDDSTAEELETFRELAADFPVRIDVLSESEYVTDEPAIFVGEPDRHNLLDSRRMRRWISAMRAPGPQGYRLTISPQAAVVAGADPAGTFYGMLRLMQLIDGSRIRCGEIRDEPDSRFRGVYLEERPTPELLRSLAEMHVNLVIIAHPDLYRLNGTTTAAWRNAFQTARRYHIEAVPVFSLQEGAETLFEFAPWIAAARPNSETIPLREEWQPLEHPHIIDTETTPLRVLANDTALQEGFDYALDRGDLESPFDGEARPTRIRWQSGSAVSRGSEVEVHYMYVPEGTMSFCFDTADAREVLQESFSHILDVLEPRWIHLGRGPALTPPADIRSRLSARRPDEVFREYHRLLGDWASDQGWSPRWMYWGALMDTLRAQTPGGSRGAAALLPRQALLVWQSETNTRRWSHNLDWARDAGIAAMPAPAGDRLTAYEAVRFLAGESDLRPGVVVMNADDTSSVRLALDKAWSHGTPTLPWPEGLNNVFRTNLWDPGFEEILDALVQHANRQALRNVAPEDARRDIQSAIRNVQSRVDRSEADFALGLYSNITQWQELEAAFTQEQSQTLLTRLLRVVRSQAELDPRFDDERLERIEEPIETRGLFVPSSILFREFVLPYRPMRIPSGCRILEVPVQPEYTDEEHRAEALFDFIVAPGPILRIDFDTVGTATVRIEHSMNGRDFELAQKWTSRERGGFRPPAILDRPVTTRYLRVEVEAPVEMAVLRNMRVFAIKEVPAAVCGYHSEAPELDADFKDPGWPQRPQLEGFVRDDADAFAEAQTTVRLYHDNNALYIAGYMREPRMDTLVASHTERNAPLWEDEAIEFRFIPGDGHERRFVVNADGVRFDSLDGDLGWDADWEAVTRRYPEGWAAEIAIPFDALGGPPQRGASWHMDSIRHRHNVIRERSIWGGIPGAATREFGVLVFD